MRLLTLPWALVLLCITLHADPVDSLITASDLLKINQPAAPAISPDGKKIAYTVRTLEALPSGDMVYRNRLWLATTAGDEAPRELTVAGPNVHAPSWHPSGNRIAFVRVEGDDQTRVWALPLAGGEPYAVTPPMRQVADPQWSPDGTRLLFTATVTYADVKAAQEKAKAPTTAPAWSLEKPALPTQPAPEPVASSTSPKPDAKKSANTPKPTPPPSPSPDGTLTARRAWLAQNEARRDPIVTYRLDMNAQREAEQEPEFTHLFVMAPPATEPVDITPGFLSRNHPTWLPDNQTIVCSGPSTDAEHPDRVNTRQLYIVKTDGTDHQPLLRSNAYSLDDPVVSLDGKQIACTAQPSLDPADLSYGQARIGVINLADRTIKLITDKFDRDAHNPCWSADSKFIYFTAEANGSVPLHRVPAAGGKPDRISAPDTSVVAYATSADDLALVIARAGNPGELYRTSPAGRSSRILTAHNSDWLRDKKTAAPERRKLKQADGTEVEYWVVKPPYLEGGFHYPLLVMIHGGPSSMWSASNPTIWHEVQFFAARGYGVVFANPRGSSGYGYKFQRASFQNWAPGPASDVLAVTDAVAKEQWVDSDRQVISGGSYGAYLATWIISSDTRFKAAIVARGVYDLTTFFGEGDAWPLVPWHFGGYPWQPEIRKLLDAQSPLLRVDSIRTPLLIKQNDDDTRTGTAQSELLYRSLKVLGRPVELVRYPRASHNLSRNGDPAQRIDRLVRFDEFFQRFIGTPAQPIPLPPLPPVTPPKPVATPTPPPVAPTPAPVTPEPAKPTAEKPVEMMMTP